MFSFLVNAEGGLTTAGYAVCIAAGIVLFAAALLFAGKVSEKKEDGDKAAGVLRNGSGAGVYHILHQDLQHAVGRQRDAVQHAFHCSRGELVRS